MNSHHSSNARFTVRKHLLDAPKGASSLMGPSAKPAVRATVISVLVLLAAAART